MTTHLFSPATRLPVILQSERSECALACMAMISSWFGRKTDLNTMRQQHSISAGGASLPDLINIAHATGLEARAVKLELEDLRSLSLPAVLHWNMNHFVVLSKADRKGIVIHDPAVGKRRYTYKEASLHVTGIAVELTPGVTFEPGNDVERSRLSDLFERYPGFNSTVVQLFVVSLLLQLASIGSAFYMQLVIDEGISRQDRDMLGILALAFLMLALVNTALTYGRAQVQLYFSNQLGFQMAGNVLAHLLKLPTAYFERRHVGDLVSRFGSVREIRRLISEDLITAVLDGVFAVLTLLVMLWFHVVLALVALSFVIVSALVRLASIRHIQLLQEQVIVAEANTSSKLMENMRTIEFIKFYCRELNRLLLWRNAYAEQLNFQIRLSRFTINLEAVYGVLTALENILVIYLAALFVLRGDISLGFLTAFIALKGNFSTAIHSFLEKLVQIRLIRLQLERVSDITCAKKETESLHLSRLRRPVEGTLALENVSYTYPGAATPTLQRVNLHVQAGETLLIKGPSGSGKSTLLKIMAGLLQPGEGVVKVDGVDIRQFGVRQYRDVCAGVLQSDQLLSGSIIDNITLFEDKVDLNRLEEAMRNACIDKFVQSLPMGYNSLIGDMGSIMSAGQQQRIVLARAFYKQPQILFLDEATANLDFATEKLILEAVMAMDATRVLISHRDLSALCGPAVATIDFASLK